MTISVAVGEQVAPAKVTAKAQHGAARQGDDRNATSQAELEFAELLGTMEKGDGRQVEPCAQDSTEERSQQTGRKASRGESSQRHERGRDADLRAAIDFASYGNVDRSDATPPTDAPPEQPDSQVQADDARNLEVAVTKADGAITVPPAPNSQRGKPEQPQQAGRVPAPSVNRNVASAENQWVEPRMAPHAAKVAQAEPKFEGRSRTTGPTDTTEAQSAEADAEPTNAPVTKPSVGEAFPVAKVLRQETHFAPVATSTTVTRPVAAAAAQNKAGPDANKGNEAASPTVETSTPQQLPFAPVARPAQQLAERIASEVSTFEAAPLTRSELIQASPTPALKTLQIQLQPADLGTVTVRLELKHDVLEVSVETSRAETADLIRSDKDTLSNLLRSSGYAVDHNSIRIVETDRTAAASQFGQPSTQPNMQASTQSQSGWSQRGEGSHQNNHSAKNGNGSTPEGRPEPQDRTSHRVGGSLYV